MSNVERVVRAGVDFTSRGELKYARAVHLFNELRGRIDEWSAAETLLARVQVVDANSFEFRLVVRREPPVDEWSLVLGDAIHNLRAVFDNVIWGLATLDGATPKTPSRVSFPLTTSETEWLNRLKTLESVPPVFLERIRTLQPWVAGIPRDESLIALLHHFDILDKHQGILEGAVHFKQLSTAGLELSYSPKATADQAQPRYATHQTPRRIENDVALLTVSCETHTVHPDPDYVAKVEVQFALNIDDNRMMLLDQFAGDLVARTREWLDIIYGGELYAKSSKLARESGSASVTHGYYDEAGELHVTRLPMAPFDGAGVEAQ